MTIHRSLILMLVLLLALQDVLPAGIPVDTAKQMEMVQHLQTDLPCIKLSGYVDVGYVYNFIGGGSTVSTQGYSTDLNARGDFNVNAVKLTLEKPLTCESVLQAGFRGDLMVGEDCTGFSGDASGASSIYLQQAYAIVRLPVGKELDIKAGKFVSMMGYEADERPTNLNITQGVNAKLDPHPSPGLMLQYPALDCLTLPAGVINGAVGDTNNGLDTSNDGYAFIGGFGLKNKEQTAELQFNLHWAPWGDPGFGANAPVSNQENQNVLGLNLWADWRPKCCNDKLMLALNSSYWRGMNYTSEAGSPVSGDSTFWTVAAYAKYKFTPLFSLAGRAEYAHSNDDQLLGLVPNTPGFALPSSDDAWSWTLTAGFDLTENLLLRAEYRIDFGDDVVLK
ncbi:MAG: outer membrane beta-barrel protein, partial [Deltaproteobacteria bacterium]